jgi:hypothetical protein
VTGWIGLSRIRGRGFGSLAMPVAWGLVAVAPVALVVQVTAFDADGAELPLESATLSITPTSGTPFEPEMLRSAQATSSPTSTSPRERGRSTSRLSPGTATS